MRILNQDRTIDFEYENFCISIWGEDIVAVKGVCEQAEVLCNSVVAEYGTREQAVSALKSLRKAYSEGKKIWEFPLASEI